MSLKKKLQTNDTIEAWTYDAGIYKGISVGCFDKMCGNSKSIVSVESIDTINGIINRVTVNKKMAEKYGFEIVLVEDK